MGKRKRNTPSADPTGLEGPDRAVRYIEGKRESGQDFAWLVSTNRRWLIAALLREDTPEDLKGRIRRLLHAANVQHPSSAP